LPGTIDFNFTADTKLDGWAAGGGATLAAGYRQFFTVVDGNYSEADMEFDRRFEAVVVSFRAGWNGKLSRVPTRLWTGAAYWDTDNEALSSVNIPGVGKLAFEADQGPENHWNAVVGSSVVIHQQLEAFAEYGFNLDDVKTVATGLTFRF